MAFTFASWAPASRCTSGPAPGATALMRVVLRKHPRGRSLGIYNCRTVRGGSTTSLHGEGRALDVGFPMSSGRGSAAGYALVKQLGNKGREMGIQAIIYDRKIWSGRSPGGRYYSGVAPHYDHVHIELTREAARTLTESKINRILSGTSGGLTVAERKKIADLRRWIRARHAKIADLQKRIAKLKAQIKAKSVSITAARARIALMERYIRGHRARIKKMQTQINNIKNG